MIELMSGRKKGESKEPKMLSLNIGENDPIGNQLVALEMDQVAKMKFRKAGESRKQSINRIFGDMVRIDTRNEVSAEKARRCMGIPKLPRKSLLPDVPEALVLDPSEEGGTGVEISMKNTAARKMSFSPSAIGYGRSRAIKRRRGQSCRTESLFNDEDDLDSALFHE